MRILFCQLIFLANIFFSIQKFRLGAYATRLLYLLTVDVTSSSSFNDMPRYFRIVAKNWLDLNVLCKSVATQIEDVISYNTHTMNDKKMSGRAGSMNAHFIWNIFLNWEVLVH